MSPKELLKTQLETAAVQLNGCLAGITDATLDSKLTSQAMTIREQIAHLGEAYQATKTSLAGGKHEWGQFEVPDTSMPALADYVMTLRSQAIDALMGEDDAKAFELATDYIILHDAYHVGQMVIGRLEIEPDWNSYAIYG